MSDTTKGKVDLAQLVKILNLTQSDSDGEALNALRMANSKLKAAGLTWQDVLSPNQKPKEKQYKFNKAPEDFSASFFGKAVTHPDFVKAMTRDQLIWCNKLIDFYNKHKYLPDSAWTNFTDLWHNFREAYGG